MNLGNQPVEVLVEDVYLLVVPSPQTNVDPEDEEKRAQAAKQERLENAELLHMRGDAETSAGTSSLPYPMTMSQACMRYMRRYSSITRLNGVSDC